MAMTLEGFLKQQRAALAVEVDGLQAHIASLLTELNVVRGEIDKLDSTIESIPPEIRTMLIDPSRFETKQQKTQREPKGQIKRLVLEVLEKFPDGLHALTILAKINEKVTKPYERTSLSPQLSRLKEDGLITLEGKTWRLKKIEPLDANPVKEQSKGSYSTTANDREAGSGGGT